MANPAVLGFNPIWVAFDLFGLPAAGAKLYSYHNLNPTIPFPIYTDATAENAWPNPIIFDENGQQGPFYFFFNASFPQDTYFLELFDSNNNMIWQVSNYFPGGGGGSVITTSTAVKNYLGNSVFWRYGGTPSGVNSVFTNPANNTVICPGNHAAIYTPDICYVRTGGSITDAVTITPFGNGITPLNGASTPEYYLNYNCSAVVSGSSIKGIAFPVVSHLKTLENQQLTLQIWAQGISGLQQLFLQYYQYTGTGSNVPTVTTPQPIATFDLGPTTGTWTLTSIPWIVPSSLGLTLGNNNNDALYLIVGFPLSTTCQINFTNFRLYPGLVAPMYDFDTYDQIDSVINTPRTGDIRTSMNGFAPFGWVAMNDMTIGNQASSATGRANQDTFYLYQLIWNQTAANPSYAPVTGGRGLTADADFAAGKPMQLLFALGRVLAGAGGSHPIGQPAGADTSTLVANNLPPHTHTVGGGVSAFRIVLPSSTGLWNDAAGGSLTGSFVAATDANATLNTPVSVQQFTTYMNVFIKL